MSTMPSSSLVKRKLAFSFFPFMSLFLFTFTSCTVGTYTEGILQELHSQNLSLNDPNLRTCIFGSQYSIVHFPMYHYPPDGHYDQRSYEITVRSQFQLLHTLLKYSRSQKKLFVFDENVTSDLYDQNYFQVLSSGQASTDFYKTIDNRVIYIERQMELARHLFSNGFPMYYEHLLPEQKEMLFGIGASLILYLLGELPRIYKTISPEQFSVVKNQVNTNNQTNYFLFDFREEELRKELLNVFQRNYDFQTVMFIAYGAKHDFSNEFLGYSFQSGHSFCLNWLDNLGVSRPLLP